MSIKRLIRERFFPHIWCAGCGHGIILNALLHAVDELGIPQNNLCMVSGIGCSARISGYVDFHSMHTLDGLWLLLRASRWPVPTCRFSFPWAMATPWP